MRAVRALGGLIDELGVAEKAIVRRMIVGEQAPLTGARDAADDEWLRQVG